MKIKQKLAPLLFSVMFFCLCACRSNNKIDLLPKNCDVSHIDFNSASEIFTTYNCNNTTCHPELKTENGLKGWYLKQRISGTIRHLQGFSAMPKNGGKLSSCEIQKLETYINSLAQ